MGFIAYKTGTKSLRQQTFENLALVAATVKGHIQTFITAQKNIARDFSSDNKIITSLKSLGQSDNDNSTSIEGLGRHIVLNKLELYSPVLLSIAILDYTGHVVYSTNEEDIGADASFNDYFIKVKNEGYFGDVHYSPIFNEPVIEASAPVIDNETGTLLGVIVNTISATILGDITQSQWLERYGGIESRRIIGSYFYGGDSPVLPVLKEYHSMQADIQDTGDVYIVNKDKLMITESKLVNNSILNRAVDTEPVRKALTNGEEMVGIYKDHRGKPIIGASVFVDDLRWVILVEKNRANTFALLFKLRAQMIVFGIVVLGIIIFVSTSVSKRLTDPIKRLIAAIKARSSGDLDYRVERTSDDELGELAISYNRMCDDMQRITISRDFFERTLRTMSDSVIITDLNYNMKLVNPATIEMTRYDEDELIDKSFLLLIFGGETEADLRELIAAGATYIVKNIESIYKKKGGREIAVKFSSFFTRDCKHKAHISDCESFIKENTCSNCNEIRIVNIAHDITQHKKREERLLKAKDAAEYTTRIRTEYFAGMGHEIRTPLNAILGMTEVLQEGIYGPLNEKQLKSCKNIETGGRHLMELINDILDISKIESGKMTLEYGQVSIKSVCGDCLLFVRQSANKKRIKIETVFDTAISAIHTDEFRLKQILINLLNNAVKFTPEGGGIGLETLAEMDKGLINFIVWDNGAGIPGENLGDLFNPFKQFGSNRPDKHQGTGLGLFLVKKMTEMLGGKVAVVSEEGKGARFTVTLPLVKIEQGSTIDKKDKPPQTASKSAVVIGEPDKETRDNVSLVLIVDDNEENRHVFSSYLQSKGFLTILARDGKVALELAQKDSPDIILMDVCMPVMDGLEAARRIRADSSTADIPIIALTAAAFDGESDAKKRCLAAGMDVYMTKPVSLIELFEAIKTLLR